MAYSADLLDSPQFLESAKHQPSSQRREYADTPCEMSCPISRHPLSMSYSPFRTFTKYITILSLEQYKTENMNKNKVKIGQALRKIAFFDGV